MNPQVKGFTPAALAAINDWAWPGNVRELENRLKRAVIMADGKLITPEDLDLGTGEANELPSTSRRRARRRTGG
jgi:two-component system NtrC family response regulator